MPEPWVAGVCSGLAVHLRLPVKWVRLAMLVASFILGGGFLLYLWLWLMVPADTPSAASSGPTRLRPGLQAFADDRSATIARNQLVAAGLVALGIAGALLVLVSSGIAEWRVLVGITLVALGVALIWTRASSPDSLKTVVGITTVVGGSVLVLVGTVLVLLSTASTFALLQGFLLGGLLVAAVGLALVPLFLRASREMTAAREQQVRDAERADIAAHLHDSVLQTLTLIKGAADDPVRVRALALTQERELRAWLYTGHEEATDSVAQAMRDAIGQVESTHGVPIDLVVVSDATPDPADLALVAAAAEAAKNAVRHGAPPVSVYMEVSAGGIDAYIKDAGPGFDVDAVPADRHGVRNSIIGRMERAGGSATIKRRETGTEVHLHVPHKVESPSFFNSPNVSDANQE